jgi:uncharacterized protein YeaO (DUF488 family)
VSYRDEPTRPKVSGPALHTPARAPDLAADVPGATAVRPRGGPTATADAAARPGTGPARQDAAEANWENEGGRLLRAMRLDENTATHGVPRAEPDPHAHHGLRTATRGTRATGTGMTTRPGVRVVRVYEQRTPEDGVRVLVDRVWPRGLARDAADLDEWCKDVAPSTALRTWYGHDPLRFDEFARRYQAELDEPGPAAALAHLRGVAAQYTLTLLTASRQPEISQAAVLASLLDADRGAG